MKKSLSKQKIIFSKIPFSKSNKMNLDLSIKGLGRFVSKNKNDSMNKETVDGSCVDTQTLAFNHDSLNSKGTINKNYSFGRFDNKLIVFSSSLKNDFEINNKLLNFSKKFKFKTSAEFLNENFSCCEDDNNLLKKGNIEIKENESDQEDTNRIDYRYYPKIPEIESNKENNYFWLATYDKLMKKSKIIKILNYYTENTPKKKSKILVEDEIQKNKDKNEKYNFMEKSIILEGYEIYFLQKFNKPFIKPKKGGKIFLKLYLLNTEQMNKIFSYINRLEYKHYINNLETIKEKNYYKIISKSNKTIYNYSTIFCIGTFVNINIFLFSHIDKTKNKNKSNFDINDLPSPNKLAKLIKILLINFPDYSKEYFIDYLLKPIENNFELNNKEKELLNQKKHEINSLLISNYKKSLRMPVRNKNSTNSIIKNVIQKIPTYTHSSNKTPDDFYDFSENIINSLNYNDKSNLNNKNNKEINNFDFFNNIKSEISIKQQKSEKNFKQIDMNRLINRKGSGLNATRNTENTNINTNFTNRLLNNDPLNKKTNNISDSIKNTKLFEPIKKSLSRHNTNKTYINYKKENKKNNKSGQILNRFKNMKLDKENNMNMYNSNRYSSIDHYIKTDLGQNHKNTRNKIYFNPFYLTNTNNVNKNGNDKKTMNKNYNKQIKVLSTIRKVISQKINNMTGNTSSINVKSLNMNNSNSSGIGNRNNFLNNEHNNKNIKYNKLVCKTNNNSKSKKSEYITPRKKKLYYYYH